MRGPRVHGLIRSGMAIGCWHGHYVHVSITLAIADRKQVDAKGHLWHSVTESSAHHSLVGSNLAQVVCEWESF